MFASWPCRPSMAWMRRQAQRPARVTRFLQRCRLSSDAEAGVGLDAADPGPPKLRMTTILLDGVTGPSGVSPRSIPQGRPLAAVVVLGRWETRPAQRDAWTSAPTRLRGP